MGSNHLLVPTFDTGDPTNSSFVYGSVAGAPAHQPVDVNLYRLDILRTSSVLDAKAISKIKRDPDLRVFAGNF